MNIDIRNHIKDNFKDCDIDEIKSSIEASVSDKDEITLPGIGVLFELLWENSNDEDKDNILKILEKALKNC